jgi:hypothetical protein
LALGQTVPELRRAPERTIHLADLLPDPFKGSRVAVHAAESGGDRVAFLVTPRDVSGQIVLIVDGNGRLKTSFAVSRRVWTNWLDMDEDGNVYLARTEQGASGLETKVIKSDAAGRVLKETPIGALVLHPGRRVPAGLLVVSEPTRITLFRADGSEQRMAWRTDWPPGGLMKVARTPDGGIIILDRNSRRVEALGPDGSTKFAWQMTASELERAVTRFGEGTRPGDKDKGACMGCSRTIFLGDIAMDERGLIYSLLLSGYAPKQGATIFQYDQTGKLTMRIRCTTPTFEYYKQPLHNPDGHLAAAGFVLTNDALFLYGIEGFVVVYPPVPSHAKAAGAIDTVTDPTLGGDRFGRAQ